jgi:hypothetical protein
MWVRSCLRDTACHIYSSIIRHIQLDQGEGTQFYYLIYCNITLPLYLLSSNCYESVLQASKWGLDTLRTQCTLALGASISWFHRRDDGCPRRPVVPPGWAGDTVVDVTSLRLSCGTCPTRGRSAWKGKGRQILKGWARVANLCVRGPRGVTDRRSRKGACANSVLPLCKCSASFLSP